jgi:hypothetical protein
MSRQHHVVQEALRLLEEAHSRDSIVELSEQYHVPQVHD